MARSMLPPITGQEPGNHRALPNPNVQVTLDGEKADYLAVPVTGEEHDRLLTEHAMPVAARFVFGFPPRHFLRLEPR